MRARDEELGLSAWVARLPLEFLLRTGLPVLGLMLALLIASRALHPGP